MSSSFVVHGVPVHQRFDRPPVEALGVTDGTVVAAGELDEVWAALPPGAAEVRLGSGAVLPAFVDAHQHAYLVAADPGTDTLHAGAQSIADLLALIRVLLEAEGARPDAAWSRFHGYLPMSMAERRSPTAAELDTVCPDRPLHVLSRTFHESAVNTAGLAALGISPGTPDPPGGRIVRDRRGRPTGVLQESASFAAEAMSRRAEDPAAWRDRLAAHGRLLLAHGITRIGDAAVPADAAAAFVAALDAVGVGARPLLIGAHIDQSALVEGGTAKVLADGGEFCHLCLSPRQVRALWRSSMRASLGPDGSLARAVGRRAGYPRRGPDGQWHTGIRLVDDAGLAGLVRGAAEVGSALAVHAVGNGAVASVLDALSADPGAARHVPLRVEHAMVIDAGLAGRLSEAGIPVVTQPGFLWEFGTELDVAPLPDPLRLLPIRTLLDAGVAVSFGSDYPAADLSPWQGIAAAVLRRDRRGRVVRPDEAITVAEALDAATRGAADALGEGGGTLEVGAEADLVWVDRDPARCDPEELAGTTTLATWRRGALVHGDATWTTPAR